MTPPGITLLCKPCIGARVGPHRCPILQCTEKQDHDTSSIVQLSMYNHPGRGEQSQRNRCSIRPEQVFNFAGFCVHKKRNTHNSANLWKTGAKGTAVLHHKLCTWRSVRYKRHLNQVNLLYGPKFYGVFLPVFSQSTDASFLISTLNPFQGILKVSSSSGSRFNPHRSR